MNNIKISAFRGLAFALIFAFATAIGAQTFTEYKNGITPDVYPQDLMGISTGPNGNLWFIRTEGNTWSFGQITTSGQAVPFRGAETTNTFYRPTARGAAGPDGNMWFAGRDRIVRVSPTGTVTEFTSGLPPGPSPTTIAVGADGNLWFTQQNSAQDGTPNQIGRITPTGAITNFNNGITPNSKPIEIALGPDGNMWFTEYFAHKIGRITPSGVISEFSAGAFPSCLVAGTDGKLWYVSIVLQSDNQTYVSNIYRLTVGGASEFVARLPGTQRPSYMATIGPDGNFWLAIPEANTVVRVKPDRTVTEFTAGISRGTKPFGITAGVDGNLWFVGATGGRIGRVSTSGEVTEFSSGPGAVTRPAAPTRAALGPDGNIWFTLSGTQKLGRVTPAGVISEFSQGLGSDSYPQGIAAGADGNLWFTNTSRTSGKGTIGRITPSGSITEFDASPAPFVRPISITSGRDGNLWFTTGQSGAITRLTTGGTVTEFTGALPTTNWQADSDLTNGPDGNLWFTKITNAYGIVRISPTGVVAEFPTNARSLNGISAGGDGNIWFGSLGTLGYQASRMTAAGAVTNFPMLIPRVNSDGSAVAGGSLPYRTQMTLGPDGNIWTHMTGSGGELLARVAKSGIVTYFTPRISPSARISGITVGADGNLWLPLQGSDSIAKMTLPPEVVTGSSKASTLLVRDRSKLLSVQWVNNRIQFNPLVNSGSTTRVVANIDLNRDGVPDLVFQDISGTGEQGEVRAWTSGLPSNEKVLRSVKKVWDVQVVADLDGDGYGDLVWRYMPLGSADTGVSYVWFTNGSGVAQVRKRGGAPLDWTLLGAMDLNGDGADDMVYVSPEGQIRVLMATANRTCANLGVTLALPAGSIPLALGNFVPALGPSAVLYQTNPGEFGLLLLDGRNAVLPPPSGNPDDPNASCTATSATVTGRIFPLPNLQYYPSFYGAVDLNGDGVTDVIWRNSNGSLQVQLFPSPNGGISLSNPVIVPNSYLNVGTAPE